MTHKNLAWPSSGYAWLFPNVASRGGKVYCYTSCLRTGYHTSASNPRGFHWAQDFSQYYLSGWHNLVGQVIALPIGGVVTENSWNDYWGWSSRIRGDDGNFWRFAHLKYKPGWNVGQRVSKGYKFGYVGETGNAHGPHLHVEVSDGVSRDPRFDPHAAFNPTHFPRQAR